MYRLKIAVYFENIKTLINSCHQTQRAQRRQLHLLSLLAILIIKENKNHLGGTIIFLHIFSKCINCLIYLVHLDHPAEDSVLRWR